MYIITRAVSGMEKDKEKDTILFGLSFTTKMFFFCHAEYFGTLFFTPIIIKENCYPSLVCFLGRAHTNSCFVHRAMEGWKQGSLLLRALWLTCGAHQIVALLSFRPATRASVVSLPLSALFSSSLLFGPPRRRPSPSRHALGGHDSFLRWIFIFFLSTPSEGAFV